jgi:hypothetical protein
VPKIDLACVPRFIRIAGLCLAFAIAGFVGGALVGGSIFDFLGFGASTGSAREVIQGNQDAIKAIESALDTLRRASSR